jgi:hypothetical protein
VLAEEEKEPADYRTTPSVLKESIPGAKIFPRIS